MAVTDDAVAMLRSKITSGELRPGERLPREADLAADLGLSRNSLREAVRVLAVLRILDVLQGDGTYVSSLSADTLQGAFTFIVDFHRDSALAELLEVRRLLEPAVCARAASQATPEAIAELREVLERATIGSSVEELVEADMAFHRKIAEMGGNAVLTSLLDALSGPTQRARVWRGMTSEDVLVQTLREHRAIFEAIERGDSQMASAWGAVHVAGVEEWARAGSLDRPEQR